MDCSVEEEEVNKLGFLKEVTKDIRDFLTVGAINLDRLDQERRDVEAAITKQRKDEETAMQKQTLCLRSGQSPRTNCAESTSFPKGTCASTSH